MRIFLVRHGMSRANADWSENRRVADHAIELTEEGKEQAKRAGEFLANYFREHLGSSPQPTKIRLWHSPYRRTRQTADGVEEACRISRPGHPADGQSWFFDRKEHFLLHEQQFGIFDGLSDEERRNLYPAETEHYEKCKQFEGKVWAKLPMGESRIDVARRMHQAFGTFKRDEEKHEIENIVVVGHGTTNRCFTMAWLHMAPEWLEKESNPKNCSIRLLENGEDKGYIFKGFDNPPGYKHKPNPETEE